MMATVRRVVWVLAAALCCTALCVTAVAAENAGQTAVSTEAAARANVAACRDAVSNAQAVLRGAQETYAKADEAKRELNDFTAKAEKAKVPAAEAKSMATDAVTSIITGLEVLKKIVGEAGTAVTDPVALKASDLTAAVKGAETSMGKANDAAVKASEAMKLLEEATEHAKNVQDWAEKVGKRSVAEGWKNAVKNVDDVFKSETETNKKTAEAALKLAVEKVNNNKQEKDAANLFFSARIMAERIGVALTNSNASVISASLAAASAKDAKGNATDADGKLEKNKPQEEQVTVTEAAKVPGTKANTAATVAKTNAESAKESAISTAQSIDSALKVAEVVKKLVDEACSSANNARGAAKQNKDKADAALVEAEEELKKFTTVEKPESRLPEEEEPPTDHKSSETEGTVPLPTDQPAKTEDKISGTAGGSNIGVKDGSDIPAWVRAPLMLLLLLACVAVW
ncbi:hypothetical protein DQ04_13361010 [Trypanosoma grayi]|uniref:hypothetical protein n=1 Tax=Trypanosoma grayi TaxID=71804 RepID=UPI0004F4AFC0|nr:hypothetical protein DQ04_13361010 [Trypanosoma grayi]KEG06555.1 hypothetical protein DQ04_13361010 [Trypanosoma grayi]